MTDEQKLIAAAQAGSETAFADLVRQYRVRLLRFLLTRCATHADAEDALQDTFINAFRYLHSYDSRWRFSTWIYRIAIRNAHKMKSRTVVEFGDLTEAEDDPLVACIRHSESENLWLHARATLSDEVFAAMWLRYAEDMSVNDISKTLDRTVSWTKVNLLRARRSLEIVMNSANANNSRDRNRAYGSPS